MGPSSLWQAGPPFLKLPREEWEISLPTEEGAIPAKEVKREEVVNVVGEAVGWRKICRELMTRKSSLRVICGALARLFKAVTSSRRDAIKSHPSDKERAQAERMLLFFEQEGVEQRLRAGKLRELNAVKEGGLWVTSGRFTQDRLIALTGKPALPLLLASSRLAELYALEAHQQDHYREPQSILARTRKHVWLIGGRRLARQVARSCMACRLRARRPLQQQMGPVPDVVGAQCAPFTEVAVDLFGPLLARGLGGHVRKTFKTWGVLFVCLGSRAVSIWLSPSYSCRDFLLCLQRQISIYGKPRSVLSDQGSQLVSAAGELKEWTQFR